MAKYHCGVIFLSKGLTVLVGNGKRKLVGRCHYVSHTLGFCFSSLSSTGELLSAIISSGMGKVLVIVSKSWHYF